MLPTRQVPIALRPTEGFYASMVESPRRLPVLTFLPTGFEPNYPYPLVVFFHGQGGSEERILRLAPRLSRRNYICLALRGPEALLRPDDGHVGYSWNLNGRSDSFAEEYVFSAIEQAMETYYLHPQRVFLAGFCEGAAFAYGLGLAYPERFAGVVALNGQLPSRTPLLRWPDVRHFPVFIGHGIANPMIPLPTAKADFRLLFTAGLSVQFQTYATTHRIHTDMLRDMNRWIMSLVNG